MMNTLVRVHTWMTAMSDNKFEMPDDLTPDAIVAPDDKLDRVRELQEEICYLQKQPRSGKVLDNADIIYGIADARARLATYYINNDA